MPLLLSRRLSLLAVICGMSSGASAAFPQTQTFVREYRYRASDADSKLSARAIALQEVKALLLEEVATYVQSTVLKDTREVLVDGRSVSLQTLQGQNLRTVAAGITETKVLKES